MSVDPSGNIVVGDGNGVDFVNEQASGSLNLYGQSIPAQSSVVIAGSWGGGTDCSVGSHQCPGVVALLPESGALRRQFRQRLLLRQRERRFQRRRLRLGPPGAVGHPRRPQCHRGQRLQARRQRWHHGHVERHGRGRRQCGRHQPDDRRRRRQRRLGRERCPTGTSPALQVLAESTATFYGVSMTAGDVYTVAGGPSNLLATLSGPSSLTNIGSGNLYFTDGAASSANLDEFSGAPTAPIAVPVVSSVSPNAGPLGGTTG